MEFFEVKNTAQVINSYIEKEYQCSMTEEERIYLTLNIKRMKDLYLC